MKSNVRDPLRISPILEIVKLRKSYLAPDGARVPVIDIPNLTVAEGEQVALEGSSGSGKTTLLNLISGILKADEGQIVVAGREVTAMSEAERDRARAETIGYIFQTFNLLPGHTALSNVALGMAFGRGVDLILARTLLERVGLKDFADHRPTQMSVGQRQRVAVARALANRPRLVLADEPTGSLDTRRARESLEIIRNTCRDNDAALLLVSHDRDILRQFERVERMADLNLAVQEGGP